MGFLDKVKDKVRGKSIEREVDEAFADNSFSRRILEANAKAQQAGQAGSGRPGQTPNRAAPQLFAPGSSQAQVPLAPLSASRPAHGGGPYTRPLDEDEFMRKRYGADEHLLAKDPYSSQGDIFGSHESGDRKTGLPPLRPASGISVADQGTEKVLENIELALKDLRAQNNHIIDLLRNIQDRLSGRY